jgi:hypothetical protein
MSPSTEVALACLWDYLKSHDVARPPYAYRVPDVLWLGRWVTERRGVRGVNPWLDRLLESLPGWTWNLRSAAFEEKLRLFKEAMAAGYLPRDDHVRLWARGQRHRARRGGLSPERLLLLREAGVFDVQMQSNRASKTVQTDIEQ